MGRAQVSDSNDFKRTFVVCFVMCVYLCVHEWDEIDDALPNGTMISHLLWALLSLKLYMEQRT